MSESKQLGLQLPSSDQNDGPVECLGQTFPNDQARREHYLNLLAEKLKDPEFRKIPGFPQGTDEAILKLSDPPFFTACPNPWLEDIIIEWNDGSQDLETSIKRYPFAADVSEGKSDPVYKAHSYHTKVPFKALIRYLLHYTQPGDVVYDGFCGSGMTGLAAQMCGDRQTVESLGYQVGENGTIYSRSSGHDSHDVWTEISRLGERRAILNDLSPAATFISYNYNTPLNIVLFEETVHAAIREIEDQFGWMYETEHVDGEKGTINYVVWSDVYRCAECGNEVIFWDAAVDRKLGNVDKVFQCSYCDSKLSKNNIERVWVSHFDRELRQTTKHAKQVPVLIIYSLDRKKGRFEKVPDASDLLKIRKIEEMEIPSWIPTNELPDGYNTRQPIKSHGLSHVHHFYTRRNLLVLGSLFEKINSSRFKFLFTGFVGGATKLNQFHLKNYVFGGGGINPGPRKGTLYAPSVAMEVPITSLCKDRLKTQLRAYKAFKIHSSQNCAITTGAAQNIPVNKENIVDYIFLDPPFGANLNYSELSFIWESWLEVLTDSKPEAIENPVQGKGQSEYRQLMTRCFREAYRLLKPGRWLTVEFSNTKASVWNNIQAALAEAGFIVANVSVLDKKQGGINANISKTAVKQDLAISAYKPKELPDPFTPENSSNPADAWAFIASHLQFLPVTKIQDNELFPIPERDPRFLFDQMVAFFVRAGKDVPISSKEFQVGLRQKFPERDGMIFLPDQVAAYDRQRAKTTRLQQFSIFVDDEESATRWVRRLLNQRPQYFQDIQPQFMQQLQSWAKHERTIELHEILELNFLCYDGQGPVPTQIHSYLSTNYKDMRNLDKENPALKAQALDRWYVPDPGKEGDIERLRIRTLLREFEIYRESNARRIRQFRTEAVRVGFKHCYDQQDYQTIISVAAKLPDEVIQEDEKLLMYYDVALMRQGD